MKRTAYTLIGLLTTLGTLAQSLERNVEERLQQYLRDYRVENVRIGTCRLDSVRIDHDRRRVDIYANATFGYQPFDRQLTERIYHEVRQLLPGPANYFDLAIHTDGRRIEQLVPNALLPRRERDKQRLWQVSDERVAPWVTQTSRPYDITQGLQGRHLTLWQSHGRHYKNSQGRWAWQRPPLFCTTEDLFTQSFVTPYIIPMLERAGAIVFTPRERDTQRHEVIVDNDRSTPGSIYYEERSRRSPWQTSPFSGFAHKQARYADGENPFGTGTARYAPTAGSKKKSRTLATWIPDIPETGSYAVYVSYQTMPGAVDDARYTVFHKGGATEFRVNQQMGGGTWVYLGTFEFDRGQNDYGFVALSNESHMTGVVSADAVRFGGGMGNIERGGELSRLPRYLEGARYWAQWAGMPYTTYAGYKGENDYADDINTRSRTGNHLSGGSIYNPVQEGLRVPLELSLGIHSDAGYTEDDALIGTLGIYTTAFNNARLAAGASRYSSRDLNHTVLTGLQRDLTAYTGQPWTVRGMWNRNYSESRLPEVPSMILETLSHQNFADLKLGHDPNFKFTLGRSVYKSLLRHICTMHGEEGTVQPLPVDNFAISLDQPADTGKRKKKNRPATTARLSWKAVKDPLEPTANPTGYVVYTRIGYGGFDNGTYVDEPHWEVPLEEGLVYSFRVAAVNAGGESFPSETLTAYQAPDSRGTVLIVNAFDRLSGPATIENPVEQGFDLRTDAGVPYLYSTSFCGEQTGFDRRHIGQETEGGLGYSGNELEGMKLAGNTFDYPFVHGKAIQAAGGYSFTSCSDEAVESGLVRLEAYPCIDLILGMEKTGGKAATNGEAYQALTPALQQRLTPYLRQGGSLLASGAYITTDPTYHTPAGKSFLHDMLKVQANSTLPRPALAGDRLQTYITTVKANGGVAFSIPRTLNEQQLAVTAPETLTPTGGAFAAMAYDEGDACAAVAYPGQDYRTYIMGFPLECIRETDGRARLMSMALRFLMNRTGEGK